MEKTEIPVKWNYKTAVNQLKPLVTDWKTKTLDIVRLLYKANEELKSVGGRPSLNNSSQMRLVSEPKTFIDFLDEIGLSKPTAYRWLNTYNPEEDRILTQDELKAKAAIMIDQAFEEVRKHRYNGEPNWTPERWSPSLEQRYELWLSAKGYKTLVDPSKYVESVSLFSQIS